LCCKCSDIVLVSHSLYNARICTSDALLPLFGEHVTYDSVCLQCFDTVGWASGSSSGL